MSLLANGLAQRGHEIHLITFLGAATDAFYALDSAVHHHALNVASASPLSGWHRLVNMYARAVALHRVLNKRKPTIILSFMEVTNVLTLLSTLGTRLPVVVAERTDPAVHKIPLLHRMLRYLLYPKAKAVVVQTPAAANYFGTHLSQCVVIPNGITAPPLSIVHQGGGGIVSMGRLDRYKAHDTLINAFARIASDYPDLTVTIYGEGPERKALEALVAHHGLQGRVSLPGVTDKTYDVLAKADMYVFPTRYEGFPNALAEAMAMGLPVIASACSGNRVLVQDRHNGLLFPIDDVETLATCMMALLKDPKRAQVLGNNARGVVKEYGFEQSLDQWEAIL